MRSRLGGDAGERERSTAAAAGAAGAGRDKGSGPVGGGGEGVRGGVRAKGREREECEVGDGPCLGQEGVQRGRPPEWAAARGREGALLWGAQWGGPQ